MKKIFLWSICFLMITALIPFCVGITTVINTDAQPANNNLTENTEKTSTTETYENIELMEDELDTICCMAMDYININTDYQTKLAILSLCANNYLNLKNTSDVTPDVQVSTYSDDFLSELRDILSKGLVELFYNGNLVYIPLVKISSGYTVADEEYPYIQEIASPWDTLEEGFNIDKQDQCGISIAGIEYLCKNSSSAEEAISWYLPDFEIKYIKFT